jgi:hypothetical protein
MIRLGEPKRLLISIAMIIALIVPPLSLAHLAPSMAGDWNLVLSYRGPQGSSQLAFPINVK